ncbi:amino acid transporter [Tothia fuscella]|uniref:Amino acid transporter n=1 Tax=Tothia fuscella TaxID=1048955 RepID=A0A9P4NK44_9PEZI|nr:amino acid transporter [Tothia fuscella]
MAAVRRGSKISTDSDTLALLGKKQVLKRRFGFWSLFAFAVCELITWETVLALFSQGLENGGPAGLIYGFLIAWLSTLSVYTVISELASVAPIASGQYFWVYMLAPSGYKKISSYMIGWLTSLAWIATVATESLFAGTIVQGLLVLNYPSYTIQRWQGTLLTWAVILVNIFVNVITPGLLPKFELLIMTLHLCGFVTIMVTLLTTSEIGTSSSVFLTALDKGGWSSQGLSYCVGFLGNVATFVGADASVHMAEEVENAALTIPRAICAGMIINGLIGFAMMITVLYCLGDSASVSETKTGFPFLQVFVNSVKSRGGAVGMGVVVLILTWACSTGITTTASRMTWSFARDRGTPFSRVLSRVSKRTKVPIFAVFAVTGLAALLVLIYIGSAAAFNDVISLTITGFYGSYFLPCAFLLWHRVKKRILPYGTRPGDGEKPRAQAVGDLEIQNQLYWGPWHIPGVLGIINNTYACLYMIFVIFWSVWPPVTPVSAETMNYSIVVTGGLLIFSVIWYFIRGRNEYNGPVIEEDVAPIVRRAGSIIAI